MPHPVPRGGRMIGLRIDPEFQALIPPLRAEEREMLESSIRADGVRDPLTVWAGVLLDGHNRYEIATRVGVTYEVVELDLADRDAAVLWMYENQLGRRNLTDDQRSVIAYQVQQQRSKIARQQRAKSAVEVRELNAGRAPILSHDVCDKIEVSTPPATTKRDTRQEIAAEFHVPRRKLDQVRLIEQAAPAVLQEIRDGEKTLAEAVREVRKASVLENLTAVAAVEAKAAAGVYDVLVIDPPWPMEKIERDVRPNQSAFDYPTMTEAELRDMALPAADDCHVWVWTTHKFLPMALRLLEAWGLKYVCTFVWHKPGGFQPIGLPQYNCEFALYARRGTPAFVDTKAFPTCFDAARGAHSEKPEAFYDVVRRVTAGRRLDMFNRRQIDGFDGWGKEAAA